MPGGYAASDSHAIRPSAASNGTASCGPRKASRMLISSGPQGGGTAKGTAGSSSVLAEVRDDLRSSAASRRLGQRGRAAAHAEGEDDDGLGRELVVDAEVEREVGELDGR